ncbi:MAG: NADH-quinone oxidoreductase subunit C [archaeon GB-1867-035]|nr:NADH-quinone oxidoreductase subunit C [Candidatus Culexmicrobium profundum]
MINVKEVLGKLRDILSPDFQVTRIDRNGRHIYIETSSQKLLDAAKFLLDIDGRLIHVTASDLGFRGIKLLHVYSFDHLVKNLHLILYAILPRDNPVAPSTASLTYQSNWAERETMELMGVKFENHPDPRHIFLPFEWPEPVESSKEWKTVKLERNVILPIGPYHPALIEGGYFKIKVDGEDILDVDIKVGFNHRGIMRLAERRSFWKNVFLVSRVCGICNICHPLAYLNAVENLFKIDVPDRAKYIRTLLAELNRIHSHFLWLGVAGELIGFKTLLMWTWKARELVQDCVELITGNRVHMDAVIIGGSRIDLTDEMINKVREKLLAFKSQAERIIDIVYDSGLVRKRTENIGVLKLPEAKNAGIVGPTARASGWKIDVRKDSPYDAYGDEYTSWDVVTDEGSDVLARVIVRCKETLVSIDICMQCLDALKRVHGPIIHKERFEIPEGEAIGKSEAPRGELLYYIVSNGTINPHTVRIRTPSYRNIAALKYMIPGYTLADVPIIIGSVDPCFACTDRVIIVDEKHGKKQVMSYDLFLKKYLKRR